MSQCDPSKICSVCDQNGLALMPLRYAVAQPAPLGAPAIQAPFGDGLEQVPLPESTALYTLRQLRGGYLYVFNEVRGEWKAYVVTVDAICLNTTSLFGEWVINLVRDNKIEVWLDRTPFGTEQSERFASLSVQNEAWKKLLGQKSGAVQ